MSSSWCNRFMGWDMCAHCICGQSDVTFSSGRNKEEKESSPGYLHSPAGIVSSLDAPATPCQRGHVCSFCWLVRAVNMWTARPSRTDIGIGCFPELLTWHSSQTEHVFGDHYVSRIIPSFASFPFDLNAIILSFEYSVFCQFLPSPYTRPGRVRMEFDLFTMVYIIL